MVLGVGGMHGCMDGKKSTGGGGEMAGKVRTMPGRGGVGMGVLRGYLEDLLAWRRGVGVLGGRNLPSQGVYLGLGS